MQNTGLWEDNRMLKRLFILLLAMVCVASAASADGEPLSTDILPSCYQYPIVGANIIYSDGPVAVYAAQSAGAEIIGYVHPDQKIHLDDIDRNTQMGYIFYNENDTNTNWNFDENCPKGWIETKFVTYFSQIESMWAVTTDQPGNRLNLRSKPSASSPSLGKYYAGTIVQQLEAPKNGYMKVKIGHMIGYMDTDFLTSGMYTPDAELPQLQVTSASGTNIHTLPQEDSEVIQTASQNDYVTVIAIRDDAWVQVVYLNETGYALARDMTPQLSY
jgi:hypothetical protein